MSTTAPGNPEQGSAVGGGAAGSDPARNPFLFWLRHRVMAPLLSASRAALLVRVGLVLLAFVLGCVVDAEHPPSSLPNPQPAAHALRFAIFSTVSIAASQWDQWLYASLALSGVWALLVIVDWPPLNWLRALAGLLQRNVGHLEAAFLWTALAAGLSAFKWMFPAIAAVWLLGLVLADRLGTWLAWRWVRWWVSLWVRYPRLASLRAALASAREWIRNRRGWVVLHYLFVSDAAAMPAKHPRPDKLTPGNRMAGRRVIVVLFTLLGCGALLVSAWSERRPLERLLLAYLLSSLARVAVLVLILLWDVTSTHRANRRAVRWAQRYDRWITLGSLIVIYGSRGVALPLVERADDQDRLHRAGLPEGPVRSMTDGAGGAPPAVSLYIVSDSQFHELRGQRSDAHLDIIDNLVPVAVRPVELDLLAGVTFRHFGEILRAAKGRWRDGAGRDPQWAHLGDFGDLGCFTEIDRADRYLRRFEPTATLAGLLPGNHDSTFIGNFFWHPDWSKVCKPVSDRHGAKETLEAPFFPSKGRVNRWLRALMNDMRGDPGSAQQNPPRRAWAGTSFDPDEDGLFSLRPIGQIGDDQVTGVFLDTSDYSGDVLGVAGAQGSLSQAQVDHVKEKLCPSAKEPRRDRVVLFMHHPRAALSIPSQKRLEDLADCLGDRLFAVVSAHTHVAAHRAWPSRDVPELVVGSILDPPQEAALLTITTDGTVSLDTIPSVSRRARTGLGVEVTLDDCKDVYARLDSPERNCQRLLHAPILHAPPATPEALKMVQQERAGRLLECLGLDAKLALDKVDAYGCPAGAERDPRLCPLNAPDLYDKLDDMVLDAQWDDERRRELVCLARAASLLQGHKKQGWSFGRALQRASDPTADFAPISIRCPRGGAKGTVEVRAR